MNTNTSKTQSTRSDWARYPLYWGPLPLFRVARHQWHRTEYMYMSHGGVWGLEQYQNKTHTQKTPRCREKLQVFLRVKNRLRNLVVVCFDENWYFAFPNPSSYIGELLSHLLWRRILSYVTIHILEFMATSRHTYVRTWLKYEFSVLELFWN